MGDDEFIDVQAKWGNRFVEMWNPEKPEELARFYFEPEREWVGLTEDEITDMLLSMNDQARMSHFQVARAIEAKLKEKNT